jgi:hypothetical protein
VLSDRVSIRKIARRRPCKAFPVRKDPDHSLPNNGTFLICNTEAEDTIGFTTPLIHVRSHNAAALVQVAVHL